MEVVLEGRYSLYTFKELKTMLLFIAIYIRSITAMNTHMFAGILLLFVREMCIHKSELYGLKPFQYLMSKGLKEKATGVSSVEITRVVTFFFSLFFFSKGWLQPRQRGNGSCCMSIFLRRGFPNTLWDKHGFLHQIML